MRQATRLYLRRKLGRGYFASVVVLIVAVAVLAALGVEGWFVGVMATLCGLALLLPGVTLVYANRVARDSLLKLDPPSATLALGEEGFTMTSSQGTASMKWRAVTELWRAPGFALMFFAKESFVVLPAAGAPTRFHDLLAERVRAAGGKVV